MANTVYPNVVIENKATDLLSTAVSAKTLMTVDTSLSASAGMKKTINTYTYSGTAEEVAVGSGNTTRGSITYTPTDYEVKMIQQAYDYYDEDVMKDPTIVDNMTVGATSVMANKLTSDFYTEIAKATLTSTWAKGESLSYDAIVDAIAELNLEDESNLIVLVNPKQKAELRKDSDYVAAQMGQVVYSGQVGTIAGLPVVVSKAVPEDTAYVFTTEAVRLFMKKDVEVEQERDADTRKNSVYLRTAYVCALVDATKVVKLSEATA
jgi:hypothetical protein